LFQMANHSLATITSGAHLKRLAHKQLNASFAANDK
jgi:hypothetical protein